MERTSASDLPILVEITRHDFSSPFKVRSFCLSSKVQVDNGLEERDLDFSVRRRRFAGALGVALVFGLRLAGVEAVVESFDGSGRVSGGGGSNMLMRFWKIRFHQLIHKGFFLSKVR